MARLGREMRARVRRRVVVTLADGRQFAGVLWSADRESLVLRDATAIPGHGDALGMDGEVLLYVDRVSCLQFPGGTG